MLIRRTPAIPSSQITPRSAWLNRRQLLAGSAAAGIAGALAGGATAAQLAYTPFDGDPPGPLTDRKDATSYNNFYEFGLGKEDPAAYAHEMTTHPWTVKIDGLVDKPGDYALEDLIPATLEERIYRFRCVEAWGMVVPWIGFELNTLIDKAGPQPSARYVAFETLVRPEEMRGQRGFFQALEWPYREGLRMDEAMHPLTILATGMYGEELPNQNGAPLRLVVPWKYGFKSIKSIVRVSLLAQEPPTSWNMAAAQEYGFFSNVNPEVDHPRWSQATERRLGDGVFAGRHPTLMFNGYAEEVAHLYDGMDLRRHY